MKQKKRMSPSEIDQTPLMCQKPDHDVPGVICGYPLPCPWHTVVLHADKKPPTVEIPATVEPRITRENLGRLKVIAKLANEMKD